LRWGASAAGCLWPRDLFHRWVVFLCVVSGGEVWGYYRSHKLCLHCPLHAASPWLLLSIWVPG